MLQIIKINVNIEETNLKLESVNIRNVNINSVNSTARRHKDNRQNTLCK